MNDPLFSATETKTPPSTPFSPSPAALPTVSHDTAFSGGAITHVLHDLEDAMFHQERTPNQKLRRQLEILHSLFQITAQRISQTTYREGEAPKHRINDSYMDYALRLQSHALNTAKALSQMSYMEYLENMRATPHPLPHNEQTGSGENDN